MNTGKAVRKALIDKEKTQAWLASELGVTRQMINAICGKSSAQTSTLESIANALGITFDELMVLAK